MQRRPDDSRRSARAGGSAMCAAEKKARSVRRVRIAKATRNSRARNAGRSCVRASLPEPKLQKAEKGEG